MMLDKQDMLGRHRCVSAFLGIVVMAWAILLIACPRAYAADKPFSFDTLVETARNLSAKAYQAPEPIAEPLRTLDYDSWRKVRFDAKKSVWRGAKLPFELQFFAPGFLYERTVKINIVEAGKVAPLAVPTDMFDFSQVPWLREKLPDTIGAAGFRVHSAINTPSYLDEFLVFLGASYFRAVAKGQGYGLSARGLSVDTAEPKGEEFPWFREFWIQKPSKGDKQLTVYALLDSESLTGAFAFTASPGGETVVDVTSRIFLRKPVDIIGLAPLTSMFLYGKNSPPEQKLDWRGEVHDSDGLLIHARDGEWLWRPLRNPVQLQVHAFQADDVQGFGLMQRATDFRDYQDLESRYDQRPSLWIEPRGDWGAGEVRLVLIPSDKDIHDNIAAFWCPKSQGEPGKPLRFDYRMRWLTSPGALPPEAMVTATRVSRQDVNTHVFVLDFAQAKSAKPKPDAQVREFVSAGPGARIEEQQVYRNTAVGGWRLVFKVVDEEASMPKVVPDRRVPIELRAFLKFGDGSVSETWSYDQTRQ